MDLEMNMQRINNFRMAAYAALATGLINLRYQTGTSGNLLRSSLLFVPGAVLLALSLTDFGKRWLQSKTATVVVTVCGGLLLIYSVIV